MNLLAPVSTIMTKNIISVDRYASLKLVKDSMGKHKFHHMPVTEGGEIIGLISKSDLLWFEQGFKNGRDKFDDYKLKSYKAFQIMTKKLATMQHDEKINVALEIFNANLFHAIPILNGEKLVGILTTYDIIKTLSENKSAINEYLNT